MTKQPNVFGNHYYTELLATGGGHFFSDKALLNDPDTQIYVSTHLSQYLEYLPTYKLYQLLAAGSMLSSSIRINIGFDVQLLCLPVS